MRKKNHMRFCRQFSIKSSIYDGTCIRYKVKHLFREEERNLIHFRPLRVYYGGVQRKNRGVAW